VDLSVLSRKPASSGEARRWSYTAAEVLATSGNESTFGTSTLAGNGNFFGLLGHGPAGTYWTHPVDPKVKPVPTQKFPGPDGFQQSGNVFVTNVEPYMQLGMGSGPTDILYDYRPPWLRDG
jgi:hypothetical protein